MAQHAILRFESTRATRRGRWKPTMNGKRSSTPATRTLTPAGASTISHRQAGWPLLPFHSEPHRAGQMPHPQGQHSVCGHRDYRQPGVFQGKSPKEIAAYFQRRRTSSLTGWAGRTSFRLWYTWMKKRPICTWSLCR